MSFISSSLVVISAVASVYSTPLSTPIHHAPSQRSPLTLAPLFDAPAAGHGIINNSYIVILKSDLPPALMDNHINFLQSAHAANPLVGAESGLKHVYDSHIKGYAGSFSPSVVEEIRSMPEVDFVERDQIVRANDIEIQKSAPWVSD